MNDRQYSVNRWEFYVELIAGLVFLAFVKYHWPDLFPFELFDLWKIELDFGKLALVPWFLILLGPALNIISALRSKNDPHKNIDIIFGYRSKLRLCLKAGMFEEIAHRWILFFLAIVGFTLIDRIFAALGQNDAWTSFTSQPCAVILFLIVINLIGIGCLKVISSDTTGCIINSIAIGIGIIVIVIDVIAVVLVSWAWVKFVYDFLIPVVDWLTGTQLHPQLYSYGWTVGAALISVNWKFSEGHTYQGCIGFLNSWVIGMLMFWVTFTFGLPIAMIIHVLYDVVISTIRFIDAKRELQITAA